MTRLAGKVALITGATGGIGAATAKAYLREGAKVMLVGRSEDKLAATREQLGHADATATFATDATDENGTRGAIEATVVAFGGLNIVFANAGTEGAVKPLTEQTVDDFEQVSYTRLPDLCIPMQTRGVVLRLLGGDQVRVMPFMSFRQVVGGAAATRWGDRAGTVNGNSCLLAPNDQGLSTNSLIARRRSLSTENENRSNCGMPMIISLPPGFKISIA